MQDIRERLKAMMGKGENSEIEFKSARGGIPASLWESYSAFANTDGGIIVLGIQEKNGTVIYFPLAIIFSERTLPWEGMFSVDQEKRALWRSEIGEHEIGVVHWNHGNAFAPGWRWDFFYAGFYMGDLAVSIESSYDYCTQAEFVEVFLAIFDYVRELEY